jgi:glutamate racemase
LCQRVINAALSVDPAMLLIASNAPTVMVFDRIAVPSGVALRGVFPPIRDFLRLSKSKQVVVMGVKSLIESPFVDPAQAVVESLEHLTTEGSGGLETWVTQNPQYPVEEFADLLRRLQLDIAFSVCQMQ